MHFQKASNNKVDEAGGNNIRKEEESNEGIGRERNKRTLIKSTRNSKPDPFEISPTGVSSSRPK